MKLGHYEEAQNDFNEALKLASTKNETDKTKEHLYKVRYNMGVNKRLLGDYQDSVLNFTKAIEIYEQASSRLSFLNVSAAFNGCGLSNFENENYAQAAVDFATAIKKAPMEAPVAAHYNNLGLAKYYLEEMDEAMESFERAIELDPRDPNCFYNRGNVHLNNNQFDEARSDFDSAIAIQSTNPKFYHAKGLAYEAEALLAEEKLLAISPNSVQPEEAGQGDGEA